MKHIRLSVYNVCKLLLIVIGYILAAFTPHQAYAVAAAELGPIGAAAASAAVYAACISMDTTPFLCRRLALLADPPAPGITDISIDIAYNSSQFTFNPLESGFICQFSQNGDCPPPGGSAGTFPLTLLPASGFNPGQPLSGSSVTLTDTGSTVSLHYTPGSPVTAVTDTDFFLFSFDFKTPPLIDLSQSTVTYLAIGPGVDFTQTSFVCHTNAIPDLGCGAALGSDNAITGITLNLATIPEPSTLLLLSTGLVGLLGHGWRQGRKAIERVSALA